MRVEPGLRRARSLLAKALELNKDPEVEAVLRALLERERRRAELDDSLRRLVSKVRDSLDLGEVLSTTVEALGVVAEGSGCYIRMAETPGTSHLGHIEYEWVADGIEPLAGRDEALDDTANQLDRDLQWGDEFLGRLVLWGDSDREWSEDDLTLLEVAAREASGAIYHSRMYEDALTTIENLKTLEARRGEYIAMVSHEIRSPMTVIAGIADILAKKRDRIDEDQLGDLVETMGREAKRLARLVSEVLDLERIDRGGMNVTLEPLDLVDLAREAVSDTGESARFEVFFAVDSAPVDVDHDKIKQVLINLMSNAVKFSPDDSPVVLSVEADGDEVMVGVSDRGPGISPEDMERLFKRFSRVGAVDAKPGSGLGLYLSRLIVERHGGRIWVESTLGEGTTFRFALPLAR